MVNFASAANKTSELLAHSVGFLSVPEFVSCAPQLKPSIKYTCFYVGILCQALFFEALHFYLRAPSNVVVGNCVAGMLSVREWALF
jgi:hypothetical protein